MLLALTLSELLAGAGTLAIVAAVVVLLVSAYRTPVDPEDRASEPDLLDGSDIPDLVREEFDGKHEQPRERL